MMIGENNKIVKGWCLSGPFHCSPTDNVLYGEASNFLIDRQPGDPTKEQSQSNFGGFVEEEYYPFTFSCKRYKYCCMNNMHFKGFLYCSKRRPTGAKNDVFALNQVKNGPNGASKWTQKS